MKEIKVYIPNDCTTAEDYTVKYPNLKGRFRGENTTFSATTLPRRINKNGKLSSREEIVYGPYYTKLKKCVLCGVVGSPRKVKYHESIDGWFFCRDRVPQREEIRVKDVEFINGGTLCNKCVNKVSKIRHIDMDLSLAKSSSMAIKKSIQTKGEKMGLIATEINELREMNTQILKGKITKGDAMLRLRVYQQTLEREKLIVEGHKLALLKQMAKISKTGLFEIGEPVFKLVE